VTKDDKWNSMLPGIADVAELPELPSAVIHMNELDGGLELYRVSRPNGVLLVIFGVRTEAVVDADSAREQLARCSHAFSWSAASSAFVRATRPDMGCLSAQRL
ncbi:hypothetical protein BD414DRAFT_488905, partial [Trametes punicea]